MVMMLHCATMREYIKTHVMGGKLPLDYVISYNVLETYVVF